LRVYSEYSEFELREMRQWAPAQYNALLAVHENSLPKEEVAEPTPEIEASDLKVTPEPEPEPEPEVVIPKEEVKDLAYWEKMAEEGKGETGGLKGQAAEPNGTRTSASQHEVALEKEKSALEEKIASLEAKLNTLISSHNQATPTSDDDDNPEFVESFPEIAKENKKLREHILRLEKKLDDRLQPIEETAKSAVEWRKQGEASLREEKHFAQVSQLQPDAHEFFTGKYSKAFTAWARTLPSYKRSVLANPVNNAPEDIASFISDFKESTGMNAKQVKPQSGDLATVINRTPVKTAQPDASPELLTPYEMRDIQRLLAIAASKGGDEARKLNERYLLTKKSQQ